MTIFHDRPDTHYKFGRFFIDEFTARYRAVEYSKEYQRRVAIVDREDKSVRVVEYRAPAQPSVRDVPVDQSVPKGFQLEIDILTGVAQ